VKHVVIATALVTAPAFAQDKLFPPDAVINVALPPYVTRPDDGNDDTAAIQRAVSDHVGTGRTTIVRCHPYGSLGDLKDLASRTTPSARSRSLRSVSLPSG
jgi:hypothetical protein